MLKTLEIDVNVVHSDTGISALMLATALDEVEITKELLKLVDIQINEKSSDGLSVFLKACAGHLEIVELLLEREGTSAPIFVFL